jgi:integrase
MTEKEKQPKERQSKSRRGKGEGGLYYSQTRKEWVGSFYTEDGNRKYVYGKKRKEAHDKLQKAIHEQEQGTLIKNSRETVGQHVEHWLENVHKPTLRLSSYVVYRGIVNKHILPGLGHIPIQKLTVQNVEAFYASKEGLSAKTIRNIHAVLHEALSHAVYTNVIARNVCDIARKSLPRQVRYEMQPLSEEQAQQLIEKVRGNQLETVLTLAITTGMRRGELLALRWQDITFKKRYLQVCRSVRRVYGYGLRVNEPKTRAGRRKIVLSSFLIEVLTKHRVYQEEMRRKAGTMWKDHDLVFCNEYGGFIEPDILLSRFKVFLREIGLPRMRLHDLRHSAATILLGMGVSANVVQELLGHSHITTTLGVYGHVLPSMQQGAMDKLSSLFERQNDAEDQGSEEEGEQGE